LEKIEGTSFDGAPLVGYEMHIGVTEGPDRARPFARLADGSPEGAITADGRVVGTYVHGLFAGDRQRAAWLARFAAGAPSMAHDALVDETLDRLASHLEAHINVERLLTLAR
jgi:adenosylcobyric acid synthase